jgi:hypothetical protein
VTATTLLDAALATDRPWVSPRSALDLAEAGRGPDPDVAALVAELGITEVLHFTTNAGLVGVLACQAVLSRTRLPTEALLEHVYKPNSPVRKDPQWAPFVNMSITRVNDWMFSTSSNRRADEDIFWVVLSFDAVILTHPGVVFTTTNNIYPSVRRSVGAPGLAALYASEVIGRYQSRHQRNGLEPNHPTDRQAEVLYPDAVPIEHLKRVYVESSDHRGEILGMYSGFSLTAEPPVICAPEVFQ